MKFIFIAFLYYVWSSSPINGLGIFSDSVIYELSNKLPKTPAERDREIEEKWVVQKVDNFDPNNNRTWRQRYHILMEHFEQGGPVFLRIEASTPMIKDWFDSGAWCGDYAEEMNAICIQLEHRYFGKSQTTDDLSVENFSYLTSQQALADIAAFISIFTDDNKGMLSNSKWVVFGQNYGGNLAAWARVKYPDLIFAAVSTSSPLLAKMDFGEYFKSIEITLGSENAECVLAIQQGNQMLEKLIQTDEGIKEIDKLFGVCVADHFDTKNKNDISHMFYNLAASFATIIETSDHKSYLKNNYRPLIQVTKSTTTTSSLCDLMVDKLVGDPLSRLAAFHRSVKGLRKGGSCMKIKHQLTIDYLKRSESNAISTDRQKVYLSCNEFGRFPTSSQTEVFSNKFPIEYFVDLCAEVFGSKFTKESISKAVKDSNEMYGGLNITREQIIYVHGSLDPHNKLGITEIKLKNTVAICINGTTHAQNSFISNPDSDPPELTMAHETIKLNLKKWLNGVNNKLLTGK